MKNRTVSKNGAANRTAKTPVTWKVKPSPIDEKVVERVMKKTGADRDSVINDALRAHCKKTLDARATRLADFFGQQVLKNEREGTQISWSQAIHDEVSTYQGTKLGDFEPMPLTLSSDLVSELRKAAKILKKDWRLNQWQAENVILCLSVKFACGRIAS
jgi:hypothetical protein